MKNGLDHIIMACSDRSIGMDWMAQKLGQPLLEGGSHPDLGTHNALGSLGNNTYLELLCPDPSQATTALSYELKKYHEPTLFHWAVRSDNLPKIARGFGAQQSRIVAGQRETQTGERLSWDLLFMKMASLDASMPFFIDWHETRHPSLDLPQVATLDKFCVHSSNHQQTKLTLDLSDAKITDKLSAAKESMLTATLMCKAGRIEFSSPCPIPRGIVDH